MDLSTQSEEGIYSACCQKFCCTSCMQNLFSDQKMLAFVGIILCLNLFCSYMYAYVLVLNRHRDLIGTSSYLRALSVPLQTNFMENIKECANKMIHTQLLIATYQCFGTL